jgi:hypothetical protein
MVASKVGTILMLNELSFTVSLSTWDVGLDASRE